MNREPNEPIYPIEEELHRRELRGWLNALEAVQERLGPEYEQVLYDNLRDLYAR